ncbi:MAG: right-handed parallel beta-helix repeat-containing protein [Kineosporiaceae bacterium]|nr:right-handed parallel beta-helix repeat-containing protein [Kineosporiaceae bacterium]
MTNLAFGLFQASSTRSTIRNLMVSRCLFVGNLHDDLEFNSPNGSMQNVVVRNSVFRGSGQFGIGLANVQHATISGNVFSGFKSEPIHIEDRSAWINVASNTFEGKCSQGLMVVNDPRDQWITLDSNSKEQP